MGQCMAVLKGEDQQAPPRQQQPGAYPGAGAQRNNQQPQPSQPPASQPQRGGGGGQPAGGSQPPPSFNGPRSFPASSSAGDPQRFQAGVHAKRRGELLSQSQASWKAGDKAAAKRFSDEGKREGELMDQCNAAAAEAYFADNNRGKGIGEIDLHGLYVQEAIDRVEARIRQCEAQRVPQLVVIVGRGNHSKDGVQKIKPAMKKLIREHRLRVAVGAPNEGCITIQFAQSEQGFVSQSAGLTKSADAAGCMQM